MVVRRERWSDHSGEQLRFGAWKELPTMISSTCSLFLVAKGLLYILFFYLLLNYLVPFPSVRIAFFLVN